MGMLFFLSLRKLEVRRITTYFLYKCIFVIANITRYVYVILRVSALLPGAFVTKVRLVLPVGSNEFSNQHLFQILVQSRIAAGR